jgi:hypothetical protein
MISWTSFVLDKAWRRMMNTRVNPIPRGSCGVRTPAEQAHPTERQANPERSAVFYYSVFTYSAMALACASVRPEMALL